MLSLETRPWEVCSVIHHIRGSLVCQCSLPLRGLGQYNSSSTATRAHGSHDISFVIRIVFIMIWCHFHLQDDNTCPTSLSLESGANMMHWKIPRAFPWGYSRDLHIWSETIGQASTVIVIVFEFRPKPSNNKLVSAYMPSRTISNFKFKALEWRKPWCRTDDCISNIMLRWILSIALCIPTAQVFRVISARIGACTYTM